MEAIAENVTYFMECTGCERSVAIQYLSQSRSVEEAIDAYFSSSATPSAPVDNSPHINDLTDFIYDDYDQEDDYVPIIPQKRQKLVEHPEPTSSLLHAHLFAGAIAPLAAPQLPATSLGGFQGTNMLSKSFQPPAELLYHGTFQQAKLFAQGADKWLLVNIQGDDFLSLSINRDMWRDESMQALIQCYFVLWQEDASTSEARGYCDRYKITEVPHVGVVDPITGALLKTLPKCSPTDIREKYEEKLQDFVGSHACPSERIAQHLRRDVVKPAVASNGTHSGEEATVQDAETWTSELISFKDGFTRSQIMGAAEQAVCTDQTISKDDKLKIRIPKRGVVEYAYDSNTSTVSGFLRFIAGLVEENVKFDIYYNYPPQRFSGLFKDRNSIDTKFGMTLKEIGISSDAMHVRYL